MFKKFNKLWYTLHGMNTSILVLGRTQYIVFIPFCIQKRETT